MEEDLGDPGGVEDGGEDRQGTAAVGAMFHTDIEDALNSGTKTRRASRGYSRRSVGAKSHGQGCRIPERYRIPPQQTRVGSIRSRLRLGPKSCRGALGLLGRGRCLRDAAARSGCAFPPAPAALRGPSSLNTCPSLTAIGIESRDCATPGKTQVITRRTRGRPTQVWGQGKGRELIENFQASGRPNLQGKCLASVGLQAPGTTASPVLMVRSWVGLIGGFWPNCDLHCSASVASDGGFRTRHLIAYCFVPAVDEQRGDRPDLRIEPGFEPALDAAQIGLGGGEILLAREQQGDVRSARRRRSMPRSRQIPSGVPGILTNRFGRSTCAWIYLIAYCFVPAVDEQRGDRPDLRIEPGFEPALDAAQIGLGGGEILLAREQQGDVRSARRRQINASIAGIPSGVPGILTNRFGRSTCAWICAAAAVLPAVSWASRGS